jgi:DNA ligase-1
MEGALFSELAELCRSLEKTTGRNLKVQLVANYLRRLSPSDAKVASYLLIGRISEEKNKAPPNIGWALIKAALDSGPTSTLLQGPLTLQGLWSTLRLLSSVKGQDSRSKKMAVLQSLFSRCSSEELEWLVRILTGEMRHGVNVGLLLDAVSALSRMSSEEVRRLDMVVGDVGELVRLALSGELSRRIELRVFNPHRPMLAEMCYDVQDALDRHGGKTCLEPKYDGVRLQIHKLGDDIRLFTRRLSDVTSSMPDIVATLSRSINAYSAILDGEVVAVDSSGRALPFQDTMRRVTREREIDAAISEVPLRVWIFDVLMIDGEATIDKPYVERRMLLERIVSEDVLAPTLEVNNRADAEAFLKKVIEQGHEGIMAKDPMSPYTPGRRGALWLKIKPAERLDLVIIAAEWGHGRRRGWLSNYHLAVLDEETGRYLMVGKTFKGLTDDEFKQMTGRLLSLKISEWEWGVVVRPEVVVEVAYNEIQRSPHYESGYALRFARIVRIRDDKGPEEIDTYQRLKELYEKQFELKGKPAS